ncbi:bacterial SH3 domain protein [mine drainage metagenome]|uniref:Bacterial SH3 domain protein n=1 Tax=mine drainage metagenome TaxID=410659 RepID=A0A1J5SIT5_9ZZZZ
MHKLKYLLIATSVSTLLLANQSMAAETGSALKNDSMRFEPFADAKVTGSLSRGDSVEIISKKGAWLQVKTKKTTGWVRILSVKRGGTSSSNQTSGVLALASGRAGTGQVVSTTGIRGLNEEELKAAKFNEAEIKKLESYTLSAEQGRKFASKGNLKTIPFPNLSAAKGEAQ